MKIIEVTEEKARNMASLTEEMLTLGGRLMSAIEELRRGSSSNPIGYRSMHVVPGRDDREWSKRHNDEDYEDDYSDYDYQDRARMMPGRDRRRERYN